ncbi:hypothetical protein C1645_735631 [Glomus cerebriforme]|uniref:Uncharacterized protein n=1 Tax=Glomus cerebriforme TaxID=658196 RepID=A0A397TAR6_9GLOM|nr:hypothetical protein C1645_735631 [Glomus cerebriforme]
MKEKNQNYNILAANLLERISTEKKKVENLNTKIADLTTKLTEAEKKEPQIVYRASYRTREVIKEVENPKTTRQLRQASKIINKLDDNQQIISQEISDQILKAQVQQIAFSEKQIADLKKEIENKQTQIDRLEKLSHGSKSIVAKRNEKVKSLKAELTATQQENEALVNQVKELETKLAAAQNQKTVIVVPVPEINDILGEEKSSDTDGEETGSETSELPPYETNPHAAPNYDNEEELQELAKYFADLAYERDETIKVLQSAINNLVPELDS